MATPEHKLADEIIEGLESDGLLDSGKRTYARDIVRQHLEQEKRRGLKDHEIAQLVNAIRDELSPICTSQQLRGRIAAPDPSSGRWGCAWTRATTPRLCAARPTAPAPRRSATASSTTRSGATGATTHTSWVMPQGPGRIDSHNRYNMNRS